MNSAVPAGNAAPGANSVTSREDGSVLSTYGYGVKLERSNDLRLMVHPDAYKPEDFVQWCRDQNASGRPLAVDLFSGAGGLSLGLTQAGWSVAVAVDHDPKALATHRANFPGLALAADLGDPAARRSLITRLRQVRVDLIAGGPPCQPFSRAGRSKIRSLVDAGVRDEADHRKELWRAFLHVVLNVKPRAVLLENVPDMALGDDLAVVRQIVDRLQKAGYRTQVRLVDAFRFGVPQHRQRLIVLARNDGGPFTWPEESKEPPKLRDAIADLPGLGLTTGGRTLDYDVPTSDYAKLMRNGAEKAIVHDHMTRPVRDDDRAVFALMNSKTLYSDLDVSLRRYKADTFDDKYKRLGWDELSRSITAHIAKDGYWYIHPEEHRTLTVREAARVQTFPDRFRFAGTRSDAFRQIGNAVPPLLGRAAALAVRPSDELPLTLTDERDLWKLRRGIAAWAARQRRGPHWYLLPSRDVSPTLAALVAMTRGQAGLGHLLEDLRGPAAPTEEQLDNLSRHHEAPPRLRQGARRLMVALAAHGGDGPTPEQLVDHLELRGAELELYRLLLGEDRLLTVQTTVRVAARVLGTNSDKVNTRTRGRLDLAMLVGSGDSAPARMAAIRLIGSTTCKAAPSATDCSRCPLRSYCDAAAPAVPGPRTPRMRAAAATTS